MLAGHLVHRADQVVEHLARVLPAPQEAARAVRRALQVPMLHPNHLVRQYGLPRRGLILQYRQSR